MISPPPYSTNDVVTSFFAFVMIFSHIRQLCRRNQTRRQSCTIGAMGYCVCPPIKRFARRLTMNLSFTFITLFMQCSVMNPHSGSSFFLACRTLDVNTSKLQFPCLSTFTIQWPRRIRTPQTFVLQQIARHSHRIRDRHARLAGKRFDKMERGSSVDLWAFGAHTSRRAQVGLATPTGPPRYSSLRRP